MSRTLFLRMPILFAAVVSASASPTVTSTTLTLNASSLLLGIPVRMTVNVTPPIGGQVTIYDGKKTVATAQLDYGIAVLNRSFGIGNHPLTAVFAGTAAYASSKSAPELFTTDSTLATAIQISQTNSGSVIGNVTNTGPLAPTGSISWQTNTGFRGTQQLVPQPASQSLHPQSTFKVGTHPVSVVVGDFNNDGVPDIAVANAWSSNVSVLIGKQGPLNKISYGFAGQVTYYTGGQPSAIAVGDFNSDGIEDLVVANGLSTTDPNGETIGVLLGNGDGTFQPQITTVSIAGPTSIAVGDFNRDGIQDVAVTDFNNSDVVVFTGKGDGTFPASQTYPVGIPMQGEIGSGPNSVAIGDFNGDGVLDLATANFGENTVSILLGKAKGGFKTQSIYPVGQHPNAVVVGDFNGDGSEDVAVSNELDSTVGILANQGSGKFAVEVTYPINHSPNSLALGDLNGDGNPDLATVNSDGTVSVLFGSEDGTFTLGTAPPPVIGTDPFALTVSDINRDGISDLVVANSGDDDSGDNTVGVLIGALHQTSLGVIADFPFILGSPTYTTLSYPGDEFHTASTITEPLYPPNN